MAPTVEKKLEIVAVLRNELTGPLAGLRRSLGTFGRAASEQGQKLAGMAALGRTSFRLLSAAAVRAAGIMRTAFQGAVATIRRSLLGLRGLVTAAFAGIAGGLGARKLVELASEAEETRSKFQVLFRDLAAQAEEMADTIAGSVGRSRTDVQDYMASVRNLLEPLGLAEEGALDLSQAVARLAIDMASFNNVADDEALRALTSAIVGQTEPLRRLGVTLTEARVKEEALTLGLVDANGELSEQAKVLARLSIVFRDADVQIGDAVRTAGSWANQSKAMKAIVRDLSVEFGDRLIVALQGTVERLGGAGKMTELAALGFQFLAEVTIGTLGVLEKIGKILLLTVENLGGFDEAMKLVSRTVAFFGDVLRAVWAAAQAIFIGFTNGVGTIVFAFDALWRLLKLLGGFLALGFLEVVRQVARGFQTWAEGVDLLTREIRDGLIAMLDRALGGMRRLLSGVARLAGAVGLGQLAQDMKDAALGIEIVGASLDDLRGRSVVREGYKKDLEKFQADIQATQEKVSRFLDEEWAGLGDQFKRWVADLEADSLRLGELATDFVNATAQALAGGQTIFEKLREAMGRAADQAGVGAGFKFAGAFAKAAAEEFERHRLAVLSALEGLVAPPQGGAPDGEQPETLPPPDDFNAGMKESVGLIQAAKDEAKRLAETLQEHLGRQLVGGALESFRGFFRDVITGAKSAKQAFADFAQSILLNLADMLAQLLAMQALRGLFAAFGSPIPFAKGGKTEGGISSFARGGAIQGGIIPSYAAGTIVKGPQLAVIGDNKIRREAILPLEQMSGGDLGVKAEIHSPPPVAGPSQTINLTAPITLNVGSLDPRGAAHVILSHMRLIEDGMTAAIQTGTNRALRMAIRTA